MVVPILYDESTGLAGKLVVAGIVIVMLILFVRAYIRNRRL